MEGVPFPDINKQTNNGTNVKLTEVQVLPLPEGFSGFLDSER